MVCFAPLHTPYETVDAAFLKLQCSRPPEINRAKTSGIITTRRVSEGFTTTLVKRYNSISYLRFGL
jgi:hypothetical protein